VAPSPRPDLIIRSPYDRFRRVPANGDQSGREHRSEQRRAGVAVGRREAARARSKGPYDPEATLDEDVVVYRPRAAVFLGAVSAVASVLDRLNPGHRIMVIDFREVTLGDSSPAT
jgi:hypothetical protein